MNIETFFKTYWQSIKLFYPGIASEEPFVDDIKSVNLLLQKLEQYIWEEMKNDIVYSQLGKERFFQLSQDKKLEIMAGALQVKQAASALSDSLQKRKEK